MKMNLLFRTLFAALVVTGIVVGLLAFHKGPRKNPVYRNEVGKIKKVLILGNSITIHPPAAKIGWNRNWGMAASCPDSDYVHRLIAAIHSKRNDVTVDYKNIADFERNYWQYNLHALDSLSSPDMLILRISENVTDNSWSIKKHHDFAAYYDKLIKYVHPKVTVIVDGFWQKQCVNNVIENYADDNNLPFVELSDISNDPSTEAIGQFTDPGVQSHPSDKGMRMIKDRIWSYIKVYF